VNESQPLGRKPREKLTRRRTSSVVSDAGRFGSTMALLQTLPGYLVQKLVFNLETLVGEGAGSGPLETGLVTDATPREPGRPLQV
jgi:hypothetical protein